MSVFSDAHCILKTAVGKFNRKQPCNYHGAASVYPATGLYWQRGSGPFAAITNSRQARAAQAPCAYKFAHHEKLMHNAKQVVCLI